eukprot:6206125-Pleurochrysis_carterae.AAC.2
MRTTPRPSGPKSKQLGLPTRYPSCPVGTAGTAAGATGANRVAVASSVAAASSSGAQSAAVLMPCAQPLSAKTCAASPAAAAELSTAAAAAAAAEGAQHTSTVLHSACAQLRAASAGMPSTKSSRSAVSQMAVSASMTSVASVAFAAVVLVAWSSVLFEPLCFFVRCAIAPTLSPDASTCAQLRLSSAPFVSRRRRASCSTREASNATPATPSLLSLASSFAVAASAGSVADASGAAVTSRSRGPSARIRSNCTRQSSWTARHVSGGSSLAAVCDGASDAAAADGAIDPLATPDAELVRELLLLLRAVSGRKTRRASASERPISRSNAGSRRSRAARASGTSNSISTHPGMPPSRITPARAAPCASRRLLRSSNDSPNRREKAVSILLAARGLAAARDAMHTFNCVWKLYGWGISVSSTKHCANTHNSASLL